jgi:hypothetical protein
MNEAQADELFRKLKIDVEKYIENHKPEKAGKFCEVCGKWIEAPENACVPCGNCGSFSGCGQT